MLSFQGLLCVDCLASCRLTVLLCKKCLGRSCGSEPGICSNPNAIIPVLDPVRGSLLVRGQKYRVVVDLEMPESPVNKQLGNAFLRPGV